MNYIKNIFLFFKNLFKKEDNILMIEEPKKEVLNTERVKFLEDIKLKSKIKKKRKVETLTCIGDGLGIKTKIGY